MISAVQQDRTSVNSVESPLGDLFPGKTVTHQDWHSLPQEKRDQLAAELEANGLKLLSFGEEDGEHLLGVIDFKKISKRAFRAGVKAALSLESRRQNDGRTCCSVCGDHQNKLNLTRIVPISKGGEDTADNLALMCDPCTRQRNGLSASEWSAKLLAMSEVVKRMGQQPEETPPPVQDTAVIPASVASPAVLKAPKLMDADQDEALEKRKKLIASMSDRTLGSWISEADFESLTKSEQSSVLKALKDEGLALHTRGDQMWVMRADMLEKPIEINGCVTPFEFGIPFGESRIPYQNDIHFQVVNADTQDEAWNMLREFLDCLQRFPLDLEPYEYEEELEDAA